MGSLKEIVADAMAGYAVKGLNGYSVLTSTPDQRFLTIVSVADVKGLHLTTTSLIAHIEADQVIIEHDINNKPLVDALLQVGIPREKIILAYAGEPVPATTI
jgi:hypothetical protein